MVRPPTPLLDPSSSTSARVRPQPSTLSSDDRDVGLRQSGHQAGQVLAVPVREGRALGLAMVGQDHEPVPPRRGAGHLLQLVQNPVDRLERLEALGPEDSGVVGDLVVVHVVDVDRPGAAQACAGRRGSC